MRGVTGVYDVTPDSRPLLAACLEWRACICAPVFCMGFKISPAIGFVMSELILEGRTKAVDLTPFPPDAVTEGSPIKAILSTKMIRKALIQCRQKA